mmetsp:Transcript_31838/g.89402  ORF Transcript_31838/g.89402 Transcript_31838/m.89402 type:complete len:220 (+) Transcript_31838:105-764(+)
MSLRPPTPRRTAAGRRSGRREGGRAPPSTWRARCGRWCSRAGSACRWGAPRGTASLSTRACRSRSARIARSRLEPWKRRLLTSCPRTKRTRSGSRGARRAWRRALRETSTRGRCSSLRGPSSVSSLARSPSQRSTNSEVVIGIGCGLLKLERENCLAPCWPLGTAIPAKVVSPSCQDCQARSHRNDPLSPRVLDLCHPCRRWTCMRQNSQRKSAQGISE